MTSTLDPALSAVVGEYLGRIVDVDSHEMLTVQMWPETFGWAGAQMQKIAAVGGAFTNAAENAADRPDLLGDDAPIDHDGVWNVKGPGAPSAIDLSRRLEVMDQQGFERQLVFPTFALVGMIFL